MVTTKIKKTAAITAIAATLLVALACLLLAGGITAGAQEPYSYQEADGTLTFYTNEAVAAWDGTAVPAADIRALVFGEAVTEIPDGQLRELPALESVSFLGNVTVRGGAFANSPALKSVSFAGTSIIDSGAFQGDSTIESLTFGGATTLGMGIFYPINVKTLVIPDGSVIGAGAFNSLPLLEEITFLGAVSFEGGALSALPALKKVTFHGVPYSLGGGNFTSTPLLTELVFHDDTNLSGGGVFANAPALKSLTFHGASAISNGAFNASQSIESLTFGKATSIGNSIFSGIKVKSLTFPVGSMVGSGSFCGLTAVESITFLGEIFAQNGSFVGLTELKSVEFCGPASVSGGAFGTVPKLESLVFHGQTSIASGSFSNVPELKTLVFHDKSEVSQSAFYNAPKLTSLTFGGKTALDSGAFGNLESLKSVVFPAGSTFGGGTFANSTGIEEITFLGDFSTTGSFYVLPGLKKVTFYGAVNTQYGSVFSWGDEQIEDEWVVVKNPDLELVFMAEEPSISEGFLTYFDSSVKLTLSCAANYNAYVTAFAEAANGDTAYNVNAGLVHDYDGGVITTPATCTAVGVKTFTCIHDATHTRTEAVAIDADAHSYGAWKEEVPATKEAEGSVAHKTCVHCGKHFDANGNVLTTITLPMLDGGLSGGAITGIAVGSTAVAGGGGFSLFWFVIKRKKWSDLVAVFKK